MGYSIYEVGKRWGGYGVTATCEHSDCNEEIDRGVSFACGGEPFSEHGCDRYFCEKHLDYKSFQDTGDVCDHEEDCECEMVLVCERCSKGEDPFDMKPEHPEWVYHLLNHYSWEKWRKKNPEEVKKLFKFPSRKPEYWDNDQEQK